MIRKILNFILNDKDPEIGIFLIIIVTIFIFKVILDVIFNLFFKYFYV